MSEQVGDIPEEFLGPAMMALKSPKQRRFVFLVAGGLMNQSEAAREAGYQGDGAKVAACRMMQQENIQNAVQEVARKALGGLVPATLRAAQEILEDRDHPQRARMVEAVLDRTGYSPKTEQKIVVEHRHDTAQLEQWARQYAIDRGMAPDALLPQGQIIDLEPAQIEGPVEPQA